MKRLKGRVVLVTGSAAGIGEGIARRIAAEGAAPVIHGREQEQAVGERIAAETGGVFVAGELSDPDVPCRIVEAIIQRLDRLDGLVNNAGVSWRGGIESSAEFFDSILAINARAPFLLIQSALPHLKTSRGCVVNIGSKLGRNGSHTLLPYSMSKAALANMTRALSGPLAEDGVRINGLNLGWTWTQNEVVLNVINPGRPESWLDEVGANQPFGRLLLPEDIAAMVAYLLSDEARMITGQVWDFDQRSFGG